MKGEEKGEAMRTRRRMTRRKKLWMENEAVMEKWKNV